MTKITTTPSIDVILCHFPSERGRLLCSCRYVEVEWFYRFFFTCSCGMNFQFVWVSQSKKLPKYYIDLINMMIDFTWCTPQPKQVSHIDRFWLSMAKQWERILNKSYCIIKSKLKQPSQNLMIFLFTSRFSLCWT